MTRHGTDRLLTALMVSAVGIIVAILAGEPEAAVLVMPWAVLLILGFAKSSNATPNVEVDVSDDRLIVGDTLELATRVTSMGGSVLISPKPNDEFWLDASDAKALRQARLHDVLQSDQDLEQITIRVDQWGVHDVGHVDVTVTEPYGLFRWTGTTEESRFIQVHPKQSQIQNLVSPWLVRRVTGSHSSKAVGRGVELADLRQFVPGDSMRDINWRASARSPDLWVSQRHPDRATDVVLLLDSFVESGHDVRTVFGLAIEGAVTLADSHLGMADRVGLVELGGTVRWVRPGAGRHQLQRLSDALISTGLHRNVADRNLSVLTSRALPPRSFVVAFTPLLDERFIDALFILGGRGHDIAVVECESNWLEAEGLADEWSRLARRFWEAERQVIRDRLAERGIAVAKWRPGDHLDLTLLEIENRRRRVVRGRNR